MKIGDYVRTKYYGFIKVKSFYYNEHMLHILDENGIEYDFSKELVNDFKSSPNIIDLIEVRDYVNGQQVCLIDDEYIVDDEIKTAFFTNRNYSFAMFEQDIKSIVTREQFERMEYRIESQV